MSDIYHLDYETFSNLDVRDVGSYRYAEDPSTEILFAAIATETDGPFLWVNPKHETPELTSDPRARPLIKKAFEDPNALIYAHSAEFERATTNARAEKDLKLTPPAPHKWRCTAAMARKAALPTSLDQLAATLELGAQKDSRGKALIRLFSTPRTSGKKAGQRVLPDEEPEKFREFGEYCIQDVRAERDAHAALRPFELKGATLESWLLDMRINDRGLPVNVGALRKAQRILDDFTGELAKEFREVTGGLEPTQRQKTLELVNTLGAKVPNMQNDTLLAEIEILQKQANPPARALRILELYADLNFAAAKKVTSMLACVCRDGYVRGTLLWHGALTGRWSGRLIQPQNMKKPEEHLKKFTDQIYAAICAGWTMEEVRLVFGNPLAAISSCIRNFIQPHAGEFLNADYASIEARIVCWLAGQEDALEDFRNGVDQYIKMAAHIYGRPKETIAKESLERQLGKQAVLGCGYSMAAPKFQTTCAQYGIDIPLELAEKAVETYRRVFYKVKELWWNTQNAARKAIAEPGTVQTAGKLAFRMVRVGRVPYLLMVLPSGRNIAYAWPKIEALAGDDKAGITYHGQIPGTNRWGRIRTYGGKLVENATQATAGDFMSSGAANAEAEGYPVFTLVHDEALTGGAEKGIKGLIAALTRLPAWADGCPIAAEGKPVPFYRK